MVILNVQIPPNAFLKFVLYAYSLIYALTEFALLIERCSYSLHTPS